VKWVALALGLICILPLAQYLRRNPVHAPKAWMLLGFLPFILEYLHLYMAIDSTADWGGYVKGAEVSILDLIAIALYLTTSDNKQPLPFRFVMALYIGMVALSAIHALAPRQALFFPWQLGRMFLVYAAVTRGCADPRVTPALMTGMGVGIIFEAAFAFWQRFGMGMTQTGGTVGHQNLLGMMTHPAFLPFIALVLAGRRVPFSAAVILAGAFVIVSTASRGTVGLEAFGIAAIFMLSIARKWTPWKGRILFFSVVAVLIVVPAAMSSFQERFTAAPLDEDDYDERAAYIKSATMMLSDHPFGVGANHFAVIANVDEYDKRAGVVSYFSGLAGNVHNFYYLTAAETGYGGLIALLLLLVRPLIVAFRCGWRSKGDYRGDLLLGLGVALLVVYLHSWVEWEMALFAPEYLVAIAIGLIAGNAQQLGYWKPVQHLGAVQSSRRQTLNPVISSTKSSAKIRNY
jgi:O-antigen ligase